MKNTLKAKLEDTIAIVVTSPQQTFKTKTEAECWNIATFVWTMYPAGLALESINIAWNSDLTFNALINRKR